MRSLKEDEAMKSENSHPDLVFTDCVSLELFRDVVAMYLSSMQEEGIALIEPLCEGSGIDMALVDGGDPQETDKFFIYSIIFEAIFEDLNANHVAIFPQVKSVIKSYINYINACGRLSSGQETISLVIAFESSLGHLDSTLPIGYQDAFNDYHGALSALAEKIELLGGIKPLRNMLNDKGIVEGSQLVIMGALMHGLIAVWMDAVNAFGRSIGIVEDDFDGIDELLIDEFAVDEPGMGRSPPRASDIDLKKSSDSERPIIFHDPRPKYLH